MTPAIEYCSECGRPAAHEELARFGDQMVCPNCKDAYAQKLREGVARAGFVRYGGFWLRFVAMVIDGIILAIPMGIAQVAMVGAMATNTPRIEPGTVTVNPAEVFAAMGPMLERTGLLVLLGMVLGCTYETFFLVKFGATPGKMALGLKVVRPDGSRIQAGRAIGRYFAKLLSAIIIYIGYIMAGFDSQKRALHDMICDTRVIKTRG